MRKAFPILKLLNGTCCLRSDFCPTFFTLTLRREEERRIKMKVWPVRMGHKVFAKLNIFVGKELKIDSVLCWRGEP